jgi:hypothetical protein
MKRFSYEYLGNKSEQPIMETVVDDNLDDEDYHNVPNS